MAQPSTNLYSTYDLGGASGVGKINREDLISAIYNVDPTDTPFMSMIAAKVKAKSPLHEWNTDALATAAGSSVAQIEGDDNAAEAQSTPTRVKNTTTILSRIVLVSGTQQAVTTVEGVGRELARQLVKKGKELRRNIEVNLLENNAGAAGSDSAAREMAGIETWIITNFDKASDATNATGAGTDARTIGTTRAFVESQLKSVIRQTYTSGGNPDYVMTTPFNKQVLSSFAGNATRFDKSEDKRLVTSVDVYVSDFGDLKCVPNRFQNIATTTNHTAFVLDSQFWAMAELRAITEKPLAEAGDYFKRGLYWEGTLENRNEKASGAVFDLSPA